jgi:hypothetical protein
MRKITLLTLFFAIVSCADTPVSLNRSDTLHADGELVTKMSCQLCTQAEYNKLNSSCQSTCFDAGCDKNGCSLNDCHLRRLTSFAVDPVSTSDGKKWYSESTIVLSDGAKSWKSLFDSQNEANREKALKQKICSAPSPTLSQVFYFTFPNAPENTPVDQWAQTRQTMVGLHKVKLKRFFYYQASEPSSNLSCYNGNLETFLPQIVQGKNYKSVMDYKRLEDIVSLFIVRTGDSSDLQVALGPLSVKTAKFESWSMSDNFNRFAEKLTVKSDEPALFQDQGESEGQHRALSLRHLWEIETLSRHYVFMSAGRSIDDSIKAQNKDWKRYLFDNVNIKTEDQPGNQSIKYTVSLDLSGYCKGAEPLYDLTTH